MYKISPVKYFFSCSLLSICGLIPFALLIIIIIDFDGWGALILEMLLASVLQVILAFFVLAFGLLSFHLFKAHLTERVLSPLPMTALFSAGVVLGLPLISLLQTRPLDYLDFIQTAILILLFFFTVFFLHTMIHQASLTDGLGPKPYDFPLNLNQSMSSPQPHLTQPEMVPTGSTRPDAQHQRTQTEAYHELLELVENDMDRANRLIEAARHRAPNARREKWIRDAIVFCLRDS